MDTPIDGNPFDADTLGPFLSGHWTKKAPTKPGWYPVAHETDAAFGIKNKRKPVEVLDIAGELHWMDSGAMPLTMGGQPTWDDAITWWWSAPFPVLFSPAPEKIRKYRGVDLNKMPLTRKAWRAARLG